MSISSTNQASIAAVVVFSLVPTDTFSRIRVREWLFPNVSKRLRLLAARARGRNRQYLKEVATGRRSFLGILKHPLVWRIFYSVRRAELYLRCSTAVVINPFIRGKSPAKLMPAWAQFNVNWKTSLNFFFLRIRQPPRSILFPRTTLLQP